MLHWRLTIAVARLKDLTAAHGK